MSWNRGRNKTALLHLGSLLYWAGVGIGTATSWHCLCVREGGSRRENASGGGTDAERVVLLLVEWEEQEGEKQHKRNRVRIDGVPERVLQGSACLSPLMKAVSFSTLFHVARRVVLQKLVTECNGRGGLRLAQLRRPLQTGGR